MQKIRLLWQCHLVCLIFFLHNYNISLGLDNLIQDLFDVADQLQSNFETLVEMESKHIDDILPLIPVQKTQLDQFKLILKEQNRDGLVENPIYYFSEKLKVCNDKKNFKLTQTESISSLYSQ